MAQVRTCERCGAIPAHRVEVSVAIWNVAGVDQPTATILGFDACAEHQEDIIDILVEYAKAMLREQAPIHAQVVGLEQQIDAAQAELHRLSPVVRAEHAKASKQVRAMGARGEATPDPATLIPEEIRAEVDGLSADVESLEGERAQILVDGTRKHDALMERLTAAVKSKGKSAKQRV
jgi:uncharacterized protein YdiU (UPF0061 family)